MDPAQKKWLRNLIEHISSYGFDQSDQAQLLYRKISCRALLSSLLHSTGLIFGYPVDPVFREHPLSMEWDDADKAKVFYTEVLLACYLHFHKAETAVPQTAEDMSTLLTAAVESIAAFYSHYKPTKERNHLVEIPWIFKSDRSLVSKVEQTINIRLRPAKNLNPKYWHGSRYNIYIFLDLIFYVEWLLDGESELYRQESSLQQEIVKVIAVSIANSTNAGAHVEKGFFKFFLENAIEKEKLRKFGNPDTGKLSVDSISVNKRWPIIIRQILFEYGIYSLILDATIDKGENRYINQLAEYLDIGFEQKEIGILAVSSFIYKNLNNITYLKGLQTLNVVSSTLKRRLRSVILKNKAKLGREIFESRELAELLWKAKNTDLTQQEREKVKQQLLDITLRIIPSLAVVMVPGGTVLLPLLLRILPEEMLLPSSFRNK